MSSFLDDAVGRADNQMNNRAHPVAHLRGGRRRTVEKFVVLAT
jgi:hypothetical protein